MSWLALSVGCQYQVPLADKQDIPVDPSVIGLWEEASEPSNRMLVVKYTDTDYLIQYPTGTNGLFFRGYPIKVEGIDCVQIQFVGKADGRLKDEDRNYHVVTYTTANGELTVRMLSTALVDKGLARTAELRAAFRKNKANKDLFLEPELFRQVSPELPAK